MNIISKKQKKELVAAEFLFALTKDYHEYDGDLLILTISEEEARNIAEQAKFFIPSGAIYYLPSFDNLPYDRVSPSKRVQAERARVLCDLVLRPVKKLLITNITNLLNKYITKTELTQGCTMLSIGQKINIDEIARFFANNGYTKTPCATEVGEFAQRGEIFDVVLTSGAAYRINLGWNVIESIKIFDIETQISTKKVDQLEIYPASELNITDDQIECFKENFLKNFGVNKAQHPIYSSTIQKIKFAGIESISPIFLNKKASLFDYLAQPLVYIPQLADQAMVEKIAEYEDFYQTRKEAIKSNENFYPAISPEQLIFYPEDLAHNLEKFDSVLVKNGVNENYKLLPNFYQLTSLGQVNSTPIEQLQELIKQNRKQNIIITSVSLSGTERIKKLLEQYNIAFTEINNLKEVKQGIYNLAILEMPNGIITPEYIIVTDKELIGERKYIKSTKKKLKSLLQELENFNEGEPVVHIEHGVGRFEGIETLEIAGIKHDCVKLIYAKGDKLYIPVENIDLIKRYGSEEVELDSLGSIGWQRRKSKLKERIGEIAKKLMQLAANRKLTAAEPIILNEEAYDKFCRRFPYIETEDQNNAINDIKEDLQGDKPMERLICGDVGFGKTEVAMRAAYLVSRDHHKKQVAVVVPTTILCRQHYANFLQRFKDEPVKIAQLSRLVPASQAGVIRQQIKSGEVDIIIGTHALLSKNIEFVNLGLLIIDEEQHFGVTQKERLKELKNSVHTLTLSATPIPRTLQMSLLGIKDLSLIATPPIDRLAVRTSVIPFDEVIIRDSLMREHFRGGRSFFVCPRLKDLEDISKMLDKTVPELKYQVAHGQMPPTKIDQIMTDFYDGNFDVLVSTAIVESGIDVPAANTMLIYKAEMFGLSQLYQLRGRVGRAKLRGYAYLLLNPKKLPTKTAIKRLEIMQTIDSLGAGFSIASHDMDLRGFGNLVGDEQSGHIKEVGAELYQEMLEEAINQSKSVQSENTDWVPNIKIAVPVFIPEDYITDQSLRLSIYRRTADLKTIEELENFKDELTDRFGHLPISVQNLLDLVKLKQLCRKLNIDQLDSGEKGFVIKFTENASSELIMRFIANYPRHTKIRPDNKLVYMKDLTKANLIKEAENLLLEING